MPEYEVDGRRVRPGRLYRTRKGTWVEPALVACPNGHRLGYATGRVGSALCRAIPEPHHRLDTCLVCGLTVYTPPVTVDCYHPDQPASAINPVADRPAGGGERDAGPA